MQLLNDTAGGQRPVDSGEMWRPCGRGKLSSEGRVSTLSTRALEERRLAWSVRGTNENVSFWKQGGRTLQKDRNPRAEGTVPQPADPHTLFQTLC